MLLLAARNKREQRKDWVTEGMNGCDKNWTYKKTQEKGREWERKRERRQEEDIHTDPIYIYVGNSNRPYT